MLSRILLRSGFAVISFACITGANVLRADTVFINFEDLPDAYFFSAGGQNIGNYYSPVTFGPYVTGLSASRFGGYDNTAYPTHSGDVAVWSAYDNDMALAFSSPLTSVSFWYTSLDPIKLTAFDVGNNSLGSVGGAANTDGTTGTSSMLTFSGTGIASVDISSSAGQYVVDDLTLRNGSPAVVPEPSSIVTLGTVIFAFCALRYRLRL